MWYKGTPWFTGPPPSPVNLISICRPEYLRKQPNLHRLIIMHRVPGKVRGNMWNCCSSVHSAALSVHVLVSVGTGTPPLQDDRFSIFPLSCRLFRPDFNPNNVGRSNNFPRSSLRTIVFPRSNCFISICSGSEQ